MISKEETRVLLYFAILLKTRSILAALLIAGFLLKAATSIAQDLSRTAHDSLQQTWNNLSLPDSTRLRAFHKLIFDHYVFSNPDLAILLGQLQLDYSIIRRARRYEAAAYNVQALGFTQKGNDTMALELNTRGLKIAEEIKDSFFIIACSMDMGHSNLSLGKYASAFRHQQQALKISKLTGNKLFELYALINIGNCYSNIGMTERGMEYYHMSLRENAGFGDKQISITATYNLGLINLSKKNTSAALDHFSWALRLAEEGDFKNYTLGCYEQLAWTYALTGKYDTAKIFNDKAKRLARLLSYEIGNGNSRMTDAWILKGEKKYTTAKAEAQKALEVYKISGRLEDRIEAVKLLYELAKLTHRNEEALAYHEYLLSLQDSLKKEEVLGEIQRSEFNSRLLSDSLAQVQKDRSLQAAHEKEVEKKNKTRNISFVTGLIILLIAASLFARNRHINKTKAIIEKERDRSENLLLNILPDEIARELKEKGKAEARDYEMVSILFSDFREFTTASAKLNPQELVAEINACFEAFDAIMGKYGIEKIKTIGDAYMAAGGLPVPSDHSVKNTVLAGLEMQEFISKRRSERKELSFEMRVGVHTGPVVAGIVGVKKFQYDIWGDAVNIASRMESNGEVGKVNISQFTYELLKNDPAFAFESRGRIEVKGKGGLEMYFVRLN